MSTNNGTDSNHVVSDTGAFALVPEWVVYADISDRALRLYCRLARHADVKGLSWPSRVRLANQLKCSLSSLDRAVTELADIGAVTIEARYDDGGQRSNLYTVVRLKPAGAAGAESVWIDPSSPVTTPPSHGCGPPLVTGDDQNESQGNESQENERTPSVLAPSSNDAPPKRALAKRQLPKDFEITPAMRDWAATHTPAVNVDAELEQFTDYHRANASTKADWVATWRTWMRNAKKWGGGTGWKAVDKTHRNPDNVLHDREGGSRVVQRPASWD